MASFNIKRFVKNPIKGLENMGRSLGKGAQMAAPFLPPGWREAASIGGSIAAGGNMKDHAMSGIGAYVGSQLGGREIGQSIGSKIGLGGVPGMGGVSKVGGFLDKIPGASKIGGMLGGANGLVSKVGSSGLLDKALGAGAAYEGYKANQKSTDLMNQGLHYAKDSYDTRAPLRSAGVSGMLNEQRPDLTSLYASGNPYSKVKRVA